MDESVFESVNKVYVKLTGLKDSKSTLTNAELHEICGLLEGTLKPFMQPKTPIERGKREPFWRKLLP